MQQYEWKGSYPQRFSGGRKHLQPVGELFSTMEIKKPTDLAKGIRTYSPSPPSEESEFKPRLKIFAHQYSSVTKQPERRGIKLVELAAQRERKSPQRAHIKGGGETNNQIQFKGIKSFEYANSSKGKHHDVEDQMQRKMKFYGLESLRNGIPVASLGEKPYKYPEYAQDFYKSGGLIPGSTHKPRKAQVGQIIPPGPILTKPMWHQQLKINQRNEQKQLLQSIDSWQQTILKQNNPKWHDPDTFFERMQKQEPKDHKKGTKK